MIFYQKDFQNFHILRLFLLLLGQKSEKEKENWPTIAVNTPREQRIFSVYSQEDAGQHL